MSFDRDSFEDRVDENGSVSVMDPAVGSGVMLLAFAKVVDAELGRWGFHKLRLYGQDTDQRCVFMCKIQLRMNGLDSFGRMAALMAGVDCSRPSRDKPRKKHSNPTPVTMPIVLQPGVQTDTQTILKQMRLF